MRKTTKSVQRPNPKYRTTFDSAMPLSYIASHYPDVRKCKSGISNPRPGLTPGTALRAVGSGIRCLCVQYCPPRYKDVMQRDIMIEPSVM